MYMTFPNLIPELYIYLTSEGSVRPTLGKLAHEPAGREFALDDGGRREFSVVFESHFQSFINLIKGYFWAKYEMMNYNSLETPS